MNQRINRRQFLGATAVAGAGISLPWPVPAQPQKTGTGAADKPALLGGKPVRTRPPRAWPIFDEREEQALQAVVRSGKWFRGNGPHVARFEAAYAEATGARYCLATNSGTSVERAPWACQPVVKLAAQASR